MLKVNQLMYSFKEFSLKNISFELEEGEVVALLGSNGSGKTTLIKSICGIYPSKGTVSFNGQADFLDILSYVPDKFPFEKMYLDQVLLLLASQYPSFDASVFKSYMTNFGIKDSQKLSSLSHGDKQKFMLACALAHKSQLFILDEPSDGIDPFFREDLIDILFDAIVDESSNTILSTHNIEPYETLVDRVIYLYQGRILINESVSTILESGMEILSSIGIDNQLIEQYQHNRNLTQFMEVLQLGGY